MPAKKTAKKTAKKPALKRAERPKKDVLKVFKSLIKTKENKEIKKEKIRVKKTIKEQKEKALAQKTKKSEEKAGKEIITKPAKFDFSKSLPYNPNEVELKILDFWKQNKIFEKLVAKNKGKKIFSFIDGPITANNPMGVHHAWGRTYKDLYQRYKAMNGFDQRYQNGFDCQGLWVEVEVEKDLGLNSKKDIENYGLDKFSTKCRERVEKYSKVQTNQSIRLGQWMNWDDSYYTMSDNNIEHIWHFLKTCHEKKWLYKGTRVMPWCHRCGTSLSQHELMDSYKDMEHLAVFLQFPIKGKENEFLLVWTTTPWTLTSNVAVAVNPELNYAQAELNGKIYYLSEATLSVLGDQAIVLDNIKGKDLVGLEYTGPFDELEVQKGVKHIVVDWDEVGETDGTGMVHIAPGCGAEDNELGKKKGLKEIAPLDENGYYLKGFGWLTGKNVNDVLQPILDDLKKKNILFKTQNYKHRYPVCWRCGQELIFRLVDEWFIKADEIRPLMIAAARKVNWSLDFAGKLMEDWLNNMGDWCISRKRYWGLPLPVWKCENGHEEIIGSIEELKKKAVKGMDQLKELHRPWIDKVILKCPYCKKDMTRIPEVGDCWLDAGIVPFSTLHYLDDKEYWKKWFPADLVIEMREQIRLWFYSLLFMAVTLENKAPYKNVLVYEKVHDEKGNPMHKSLGNAIWFDDAVEKMGADVMRWIYINQNPQFNLNFGYGPAAETKRTLEFLFNILKYIDESKTEIKNALKIISFEKNRDDFKIEDKWIISRLNTVKKNVTNYLEQLKPNLAAKELQDFFVNDLSRGYIQFTRNRLSGIEEEGSTVQDRALVIYVLENTMLSLLKMMAPFTPFLAEELYQRYYKSENPNLPESIHLTEWPIANVKNIDNSLEENMNISQNIVQSILACRDKIGRGVRWPLKDIVVVSQDQKIIRAINVMEDVIKAQTNVKEIWIFHEMKGLKESVKADYNKLGPKFGNLTPKIIAQLSIDSPETVLRHIKEDGKHTVYIDVGSGKKESIDVLKEHLIITKEVPAPYVYSESKFCDVYVNTEKNELLEAEGFARELMRRIQVLRKDNGMKKSDTIIVYVKTDEPMTKMLASWEAQIKEKVGADLIKISFVDPSKKHKIFKKEKIKGREFDLWVDKV